MQSILVEAVSELLYLHDCVVVPELGGFVSRKVPSKINFANGSILPPSKSVIFNKNLVNNDGLLANFLLKKFNLSYFEANSQISNFVLELKLKLQNNHRVELYNLGTFYFDLEKNIQFEASTNHNFLPESFGLQQISFKKIELEPASIVERKDRVQKTSSNGSYSLRRKTIKAVSVVGAVCLVIGFMIAVSLSPKNSFLAGLNPFSKGTPLKYSFKKYSGNLENLNDTHEKNVITLNENGTGTMTINGEDKIVFVYVGKENKNEVKNLEREILSRKNPYLPPSDSKPFEIIIGCFREKSNADRMMKNACANQFPARVIGKNEKNLYVVSAGGYPLVDIAANNLEKVRSKYSDAWVLKK